MFNLTLIWFMLLPLAGSVAVWALTGRQRQSLIAGGIFGLVSALVIIAAFAVSHGVKTSDTEIWNGKITSKDRVHGSYVRTYDCNCVQSCSGSGSSRSCTTTCQTCYENHYTVNWQCGSTVGPYTIDSADWTNSGVYALPSPRRWVDIGIGDPVARSHSYTNYVQAVPESLFRPSGETLKKQFASLIPAYPSDVFDFYRINRFLTPGYSTPDAPAWNASLSELLKDRGPKKQVNTVIVVAKTGDANYAYALRDAWLSAKKNDVVLVIGSSAWPKIDFVDVISWTKNELFKVQLRDSVMALDTIQRQPILDILATQIDTNFERRHMSEFKYLEAEIDPPTWLLWLLAGAIAGAAVGVIYFFNGRSFTYTPPRYNRYR